MNTKVVLCADIGTSSLKLALINQKGNPVSYSRQNFFLYNTAHAAREWPGALKNGVSDLFENLKEEVTVEAFCISGNGPTITAQDYSTLLWKEDISSDLNFSPDKYPTKSLFLPRICAFRNRFPDSWKNSEHIFSGPEFLIWHLTGSAVTILPEARYETAYWNRDSARLWGLTEEDLAKLPGFVSPSSLGGKLTADSANQLSCPKYKFAQGLKVFCGAPDFVSALVGTNTLKSGKLCDRAGSSEGLNLCTPFPVTAKNLRTLPSIIPGLWNLSYLIPDSGKKFNDFKQQVERTLGKQFSYDEIVGLYIGNDGTEPLFDQGKFLMLQTALKVRDGIREIRNAIKDTDIPFPDTMTVTGGQAHNNLWLKMKADVTGMKITKPACTDAELTGDAIFAWTGLGLYESITEAADNLVSS